MSRVHTPSDLSVLTLYVLYQLAQVISLRLLLPEIASGAFCLSLLITIVEEVVHRREVLFLYRD
jgi:hypothetical protein